MQEENKEQGFQVQEWATPEQALRWIVDGIKPVDKMHEIFTVCPEVFDHELYDKTPLIKYKFAAFELLNALQTGQLKSHCGCSDWEGNEFTEIPKDAWRLEHFWDETFLRLGDEDFHNPVVFTEELMDFFPFRPSSVANNLLVGEAKSNSREPTKVERRGRKSPYDWNEFFAEIAIRGDLDGRGWRKYSARDRRRSR